MTNLQKRKCIRNRKCIEFYTSDYLCNFSHIFRIFFHLFYAIVITILIQFLQFYSNYFKKISRLEKILTILNKKKTYTTFVQFSLIFYILLTLICWVIFLFIQQVLSHPYPCHLTPVQFPNLPILLRWLQLIEDQFSSANFFLYQSLAIQDACS